MNGAPVVILVAAGKNGFILYDNENSLASSLRRTAFKEKLPLSLRMFARGGR